MAGQAQEARSPSGLGRAPTAEKLPAHGSARLLGILTFLPRAIRRELTRTGATDIVLENLGDGYAVLHTDDGDSFRWQGRARVILDRLRRLPNRAGSAAVISEFAEDEGLVAPASPLAPADAEHGYIRRENGMGDPPARRNDALRLRHGLESRGLLPSIRRDRPSHRSG